MSCHCCGYPIATNDSRHECAFCNGQVFGQRCAAVHGDRLQEGLEESVRQGKITAWTAIGFALIDDARLTTRLACVPRMGALRPWIANPPRRWEVYLARRDWHGPPPELRDLCRHALEPWIGAPNTAAVRAEICEELAEAAQAMLRTPHSITISIEGPRVDRHGITCEVFCPVPFEDRTTDAPAPPRTAVVGDDEVDDAPVVSVTPPASWSPNVPGGKAEA